MATGPSYRVAFRRRRQGKTDYQQRRSLVLSGLYRMVVRGSLENISVQMIEAKVSGDKVIASARSNELAKSYGWLGGGGNLPAAYLTGLLCGYKAVAKDRKEAVLDLGLHAPTKGSRVFAALKGVLDAGLRIPHDANRLPSENRLNGSHIVEYAKHLSSNQEVYEKRFSGLLARGLRPEAINEHFLDVKQKISSSFQRVEVDEKKPERKKRRGVSAAKKTVKPKVEKREKPSEPEGI